MPDQANKLNNYSMLTNPLWWIFNQTRQSLAPPHSCNFLATCPHCAVSDFTHVADGCCRCFQGLGAAERLKAGFWTFKRNLTAKQFRTWILGFFLIQFEFPDLAVVAVRTQSSSASWSMSSGLRYFPSIDAWEKTPLLVELYPVCVHSSMCRTFSNKKENWKNVWLFCCCFYFLLSWKAIYQKFDYLQLIYSLKLWIKLLANEILLSYFWNPHNTKWNPTNKELTCRCSVQKQILKTKGNTCSFSFAAVCVGPYSVDQYYLLLVMILNE